jgi:hypothetical protein
MVLSLDDPRWGELSGAYGVPFDARPLLRRLERDHDSEDVWNVLWSELHHQGDVGVASYAVVPHLVDMHSRRRFERFDFFALLAAVETERHRRSNPSLPDWLRDAYVETWKKVGELALADLRHASDKYAIRAILSVLALSKKQLRLGAFLIHLEDSEFEELLEDQLEWSEVYDENHR